MADLSLASQGRLSVWRSVETEKRDAFARYNGRIAWNMLGQALAAVESAGLRNYNPLLPFLGIARNTKSPRFPRSTLGPSLYSRLCRGYGCERRSSVADTDESSAAAVYALWLLATAWFADANGFTQHLADAELATDPEETADRTGTPHNVQLVLPSATRNRSAACSPR